VVEAVRLARLQDFRLIPSCSKRDSPSNAQ
jgi:hypothetical protein